MSHITRYHMWDMTHSYVRHDSSIFETWLIRRTNESYHTWSFVRQIRHGSFVAQMSDITRYKYLDKRYQLNSNRFQLWDSNVESLHIYKWVIWHIWMNHITRYTTQTTGTNSILSGSSSGIRMLSHCTYMNESYCTYEWVMSHVTLLKYVVLT